MYRSRSLGWAAKSQFTDSSSYFNRYTNGLSASSTNFGSFSLFGGTVSLGSRLRFPDDNFVSATALNFQHYDLKNWSSGLFQTSEGTKVTSNLLNFNLKQTIARSRHLPFHERVRRWRCPWRSRRRILCCQNRWAKSWWSTINGASMRSFTRPFKEDHMKKLAPKSAYSATMARAAAPRSSTLQLGGDALDNRSGGYTGTDIITMRGYEVSDFENNLIDGEQVANVLFNKFTVEMRYPFR